MERLPGDLLPSRAGLTASGLYHGHFWTGGDHTRLRGAPRAAGLNRVTFLDRFRRRAVLMHGHAGALLRMQRRVLHLHPAVMRGIFLAIDRAYMRRVAAEIGPADTAFLAVGIEPFPA